MDALDDPGPEVVFSFDGEDFSGYAGDTIACALYAARKRAWRMGKAGERKGMLCGMGICFDCLVSVDGVWGVRACQVEIRPGMVVVSNMKVERP